MNSNDLTPRSRLSKYAKAASCLVFVIVCTHCCDAVFADTSAETEAIEPDRFEKEVVASGCKDAVDLDISADGRIVFVERKGAVKTLQLRDAQVVVLAQIPVAYIGEVGLVGVVLDKDFRSERLDLSFAIVPKVLHPRCGCRASPSRATSLISTPRKSCSTTRSMSRPRIHMGGGLVMDKNGNLYMGTGDNSPPIAELPSRPTSGKRVLRFSSLQWQIRKDLRGKILRVHPRADGGYDIPAGNLFPDGKEGRREIYCMGCRNPFRLVIRSIRSGWLYWGDVGPNILDPSTQDRPRRLRRDQPSPKSRQLWLADVRRAERSLSKLRLCHTENRRSVRRRSSR